MKTISLFSVILLLSMTAFSQTKLIAHRSHSGSNNTFTVFEPGNFGLPTTKKDTTSIKVDTVKKKIQRPIVKKKHHKNLVTVASK